MFSNFFVFILAFFLIMLADILLAPNKDKTPLYEVMLGHANSLLVFTVCLLFLYNPYDFPFQFQAILNFFVFQNFFIHVSLDGIGLAFLLLTSFFVSFLCFGKLGIYSF